jgi:hypothetical protein
VTIPTPDPIVTVVEPDRDSRRVERRENRIDADQSQQELLDQINQYRGKLADTIDELHTRLSPKWHLDQLKEEVTTAGKDALAIVKGDGKPVDETRAKNADNLIKGASALAGLWTLSALRRGIKSHRTNRKLKRTMQKIEDHERFKVTGVVEEPVLIEEK